MSEQNRALFIRPNGYQSGKTVDQFRKYMEHWTELGFPTSIIEFVTPEIMDLQKGLKSARESLAIAERTLNEIASWCPTPEDPDKCRIAECKVARKALAEIKARGDSCL